AAAIAEAVLEAKGTKDETVTFTADQIANAAKEQLDETYTLDESSIPEEGVTVTYGSEAETVELKANKKKAEDAVATLNIKVYDAEAEEGSAAIAEAVLEAKGTEGETVTFKADEIADAAKEQLNESYTLDESSIPEEGVTVTYGGEAKTVELTATPKEKATATLIVKVYNTPTVPADPEEDEEEDRTGLIVEVTDTDDGNVGDSKAYTAAEIEALVKEEVEAKGYTLDDVEDGADVKYGETVVVKLTATAGEGHTYVKFDETYYTKSNGNWQTGTSYVCIDCGHAFELDEDGETVEENLRSNDKLLSDADIAEYAKNTTEIWTWSTDGTEASMYTVPTALKDHMFDCVWENSAFSSREVATVTGDCETGKFTAELKSGKTATKTVTAGHHSYLNQEETDDNKNVTQEAAVQWTWADDFSSATASFICDVCGKTSSKTVSGDDIKKETKDPTCSDAGSNTYTATVTVDGVNYISSRSEEIPATGKHTYEDGVCTVCGEKENPFVDVSEEDYYYDAVLWAVHNGITVGKDETHFEPKANCTRAQVVTFLWRTMGEPEPETTENPFVDVAADAYYHDAVLWAYENGITVGIDSTHFAPGDTVTRCQFVAFLHRNEGEPEPKTTENPFVDVSESKYYYNAVLWAYENGITVGKDETHFAPDKTCTRAEVVTFLYRTYGEEE
ncbi:MAG: S-layer homology domain-containing protein, partial [Lachnospiraceae bacterium]